MANAENAKLQYEGGQNQVAMGELVNSGDNKVFESGADLWSRRAGFAPVVRPDGLITGGAISPAQSALANAIDVAALTAYVGGEQLAVAGKTDLVCARAVTETHLVYSIVVAGDGNVTAEAGTEGTSFSETRGAAGAPPLVPVDAIEIGQVRLSSSGSAVIKTGDIKQVVGVHQERFDSPLYSLNYRDGTVEFNAALPAIHAGGETKGVHASYAEPIFADIQKSTDFVPSETSHSISSTQIYGTTLGSSSSSLNQATFTAYFEDGITDPLVRLKNEFLWFKFFPDRNRAGYILEQGKLGIARTFPAGADLQASCTISVEQAGSEVAA